MKIGFLPPVLGFILLAFAGCATADRDATPKVSTAFVRELNGEAQVAQGQGEWKRARMGDPLREGDRARTGPGGTMVLFLGDHGGVMKLMPESQILIERLGPVASEPDVVAIVALTAGRIVGDTMNKPHGKVLIRTLAGTHELR